MENVKMIKNGFEFKYHILDGWVLVSEMKRVKLGIKDLFWFV